MFKRAGMDGLRSLPWASIPARPPWICAGVAGLGQLGRIEEARAALAELKLMDANLESSARNLRRTWADPGDVDHLLEGLRKAGFE
jgi:hypothetical protein